MDTKTLLLSCLVLLSSLLQVANGANTYKAAVVEYNPIITDKEDTTINQNLDNFKKFMEEAKKQSVDIIAFPEYGLWIRKTYSAIPNPAHRINPCDSKFNTTKLVKDLSCAAKKNAMYTLVNLLENRTCTKDDPNCPKEGYYKYNTNVVFDRKGTVIARYSKFNLYDEAVAQKPKVAEISFFDTDFGVRFGVFTSFDIHFPVPGLKLIEMYKITDFIIPCYWFSELPYLTALQIYRGWAETNNVNLLATGLNHPGSGTFGSGIFNGRNGHIVQMMSLNKTRQLLYATVPKIKKTSGEIQESVSTSSGVISLNPPGSIRPSSPPNNYKDSVFFIRDQLHLFTSEVVKTGQIFQKPVCSHDKFCCNFRINYEATSPQAKNYTLRAMAYNGIRKFGMSFKAGIQACGVVLCEGPHIMNCTNWVPKAEGLFKVKDIQIKGDFRLRNSFQVPSTLAQGKALEPLPASGYTFLKVEKNKNMVVSLELKAPVTNLLTFAIWGRDFTKDV